MPYSVPSRLLLNLLVWIGLWALLQVGISSGIDNYNRFWGRLLPGAFGIFLIVAVNVGWLLPRYYFRGKRLLYFGGAFLLVAVPLYLAYFNVLEPRFPGRGGGRRAFVGLFHLFVPTLLALLGSTSLEVMGWANRRENAALQSERERLTTELKFLKSQINPHFLFNSLNNIYTLALLKDDLAAESLLRLSAMLRYVLYEADSNEVPLHRELSYICDYVDLAQLKDSRGLNIKLDLDTSQPDFPLAPLLLIPLVENALKHGRVERVGEGFITIKLITRGNTLEFTVINDYLPSTDAKDAVGGIGLANVTKRLELLYPGRHQLLATGDGQTFTARLHLTRP